MENGWSNEILTWEKHQIVTKLVDKKDDVGNKSCLHLCFASSVYEKMKVTKKSAENMQKLYRNVLEALT